MFDGANKHKMLWNYLNFPGDFVQALYDLFRVVRDKPGFIGVCQRRGKLV